VNAPFSVEEFYLRCADYLAELKQAQDFDAVHRLWTSTKIEYHMEPIDPYSPEYRNNVLATYNRLACREYQAINELTSVKQSVESFQVGYPWISKNCRIAAEELAKVVQALNALASYPDNVRSVIEFGSGWGNLAHPLAKLGLDVTAVDIDPAFLQRLESLVDQEGLKINTIHGDFLEVATQLPNRYDVAIFQSSFHHCLEFDNLVSCLYSHVLKEKGRILFLAEPIFKNYSFPWGLRYDGESLWAIMCNHWLELGFDEDFFLAMIIRHGFFVRRIAAIPGFVGDGWSASRCREGIAFAECILPSEFAQSFWDRSNDVEHGRFLRGESLLPALQQESRYQLIINNFCVRPLRLNLRGDDDSEVYFDVPAHTIQTIIAPSSQQKPLQLHCQTVIPDRLIQNGDQREIGVALVHLATL
jgi:2-polyprenyl-3-methyl-5-hydroxy-6-metoxy-1,4-benzoquinol methylase